MADYMIGKGRSGKDRYMVGYNESSANKSAYRVGAGDSQVKSPSKALPGDQDPVVGSKSQFSHAEKDTKDDGSASANMGFGGMVSGGPSAGPVGAGGQIELTYAEKGDWSDAKNAIAKRKAQMEAMSQIGGDKQYNSPTVDLVSLKK